MATPLSTSPLLRSDGRRALGVVYTPEPLASFLLDRLLGPGAAPDDVLVDPSCGAGVFLVACVRRLAERDAAAGRDVRGVDRDIFLNTVADLLWGVDVDPNAVERTRESVLHAVLDCSPGLLPVDFFRTNVRLGDFLIDDVELPRPPRYIVGNPPYVPIAAMSGARRQFLRTRFAVATGRMDLYVLFMQRCGELLVDGGTWCLITPDKYLTSLYGAPVRELLVRTGHISELILFASHKVFSNAATVPCVTVWQKNPGIGLTTLRNVSIHVDSDTEWTFTDSGPMRSISLLAGTWEIDRSVRHPDLRERISRAHPVLSEYTTRISAGIATGLNSAFVFEGETDIESELLHPALRGRDILPFEIRDTDRRILIPYVWDDDGRPTLVDLDAYPAARAWLEAHRGALQARHCVRAWKKQWWDLHDPVTVPLHRLDKVLVPDIARGNRFAADRQGFVPQNTVYYIIPRGISCDALAAVLNSKPIEYLIKTSAPLMKDGFFRYRQQFLRCLPIPRLDVFLEEQILAALRTGDRPRFDELTSMAYGVDEYEVNAALSDLSGGGGSPATGV